MSTLTGSTFTKSSEDNTVVLLRAGGTKPIAEFGGSVDDSNYMKKIGQLSQSFTGKLVRTDSTESFDKKTSKNLQVIEGYLRNSSEPEEVSEEDEDYITRDYAETNGFIKSGGTNQQVLLANGTTKPLSEFIGTPTYLSIYYNKSEIYSRIETDKKFVRLEGSIQQTKTGRLKYVNPFGGAYDETQDPVEKTCLTQSEVDVKLINYVKTVNNQSTNGTKTLNANINATGFVKTGKDDTSVLLAGGVVRLLSAFGGVQVEDITNLVVDLHSNITFNYLRLVRIGNFYHLMMDFQPKTQINVDTKNYVCSIGSFSNNITPLTPANAIYLILIISSQTTLIGGLATRQVRISTDSSTPWGINDVVGKQFSWML
ncbi:MAG: hypothetical protein EZS28_025490 [Streblomastix strix]|uniref:Uncharacterized protein n=1 Tax=Streblomastix strix TaxID=222440 RepID=A0A5J4V916_9EUKA|nr:MAG: hypothetical protein EZS28_025490 [Streblomastix strix]